MTLPNLGDDSPRLTFRVNRAGLGLATCADRRVKLDLCPSDETTR